MAYIYNGEIREGKRVELALNNRALNYGDGVFETIKYSFKRINFWEDHYFRLMSSMRILRMEIPANFSPEYLEEQLRSCLEANGLIEDAARLKLLVFRKAGGYYTPNNNGVDFIISASPLEHADYRLNSRGLEIDLYKDFYKQKGLLSNLKQLGAALYTIASVYRAENDLDECVLLNDDKQVVEAISSNLFMVKNKEVFTAPLETGCLKGVMRKQVIDLLPKLGYEVREESFSPFELQRADEVFLTNAINGDYPLWANSPADPSLN
jgi:branched-chain amino acid aminotransferase